MLGDRMRRGNYLDVNVQGVVHSVQPRDADFAKSQ